MASTSNFLRHPARLTRFPTRTFERFIHLSALIETDLRVNGCFRRLGPVFSKGLRLSRGGLCTFGYVISRKATDIFLTHAALKSEKPIDHMMDEEVLSGRMLAFHADPPLVYTRRDVKSTLAY